MGKKPWAKPELTVLVRSYPEECILDACKNIGISNPVGTDPGNYEHYCIQAKDYNCPVCYTNSGS